MRKILVITFLCFGLCFGFASPAAAQIPSGNVFFGYSYYSTNVSSIDRINTNGWEGSVEGKIIPFLGMVADFSAHYGTENFQTAVACPGIGCPALVVISNVSVAEHNYLFGPRVSVPVGKYRPFGEVMIGVAHVNADGAGSDTSFVTAAGGGLDYRLIRLVAWRFQGDYVQTRFFGTHQNNVRLSTGIVIRF